MLSLEKLDFRMVTCYDLRDVMFDALASFTSRCPLTEH